LFCAILCALASCGSQEPTSVSDTDTVSTAAVTAQTEALDEYGRALIPSSLPAGLDLGGEAVRILYREPVGDLSGLIYEEFNIAESTGDIVEDAIYIRNRETEDELNVRLELIPESQGNINDTLKNSVLSGENAYDIAAIHAYYGPAIAADGFMYNLAEVENLDLANKCWVGDFIEQMTIRDSLYLAVGHLSLSATDRVYATFFNKTLASDYIKDDLYDIVNDGKWTLEKFGSYVSDVYSDINGDSARDPGDLYGWAVPTASVPFDVFTPAMGISVTTDDADGVPQLSIGSERMFSAYSALYDLIYNNSGVLTGEFSIASINDMRLKFAQSQSVFLIEMLDVTNELRDMDDDYGVLPVFKYDEAQSGYYTTAQDAYSVFGITSTCRNTAAAGAVLQLLNEKSYASVTPAYFGIALKTKYSRDNADSQMYDIILDGRIFNFGNVYSGSLDGVGNMIRSQLAAKKENIASYYESQQASVQKLLNELIGKYDSIGK